MTPAPTPTLVRGLGLLIALLAALSIGAGSARAAATLAVDAQVSTHQSTASTSIASPAFTTHQTGEVLLAFARSDGTTNGIAFTSVTGGNLTWTRRALANGQPGTAEIWQAIAPNAVTNVNVTATLPSPEAAALTVVAFSGANTTTNGAVVTSSSPGSLPSVSLATTVAGSWVWGVGTDWDAATSRTVGAGQTLDDQFLEPVYGETFWVQSQTNLTASAGTTVTLDDTAPSTDRWDMAAIEVLPATAGGGTPPPTAPTNLAANVIGPSEVDLSWTASTSSAGVASYSVTRNATQIGSSATTAYADLTTSAATTYTYTVTAVDSLGQVSGASNSVTVTTPAGSASTVGQWGALIPWPIVSVHAMLTYTGKILTMQGDYSSGGTQYLYDPNANTNINVPNAASDLFCAGQAVLADGRIAVIGGTSTSGGLGTPYVNAFNPGTQTWQVLASMHYPRWYSTGTTLGDGRVLASSGYGTSYGNVVPIPEVYDPSKDSWTDLSGATNAMPVYPFMYQLPDGRVLHAGGSETPTITEALNLSTQTWTPVDGRIIDGASIVNYAPGKFMKAGSAADSGNSGPSSNTAFTLDMNQPSPTWQPTGSMQYPRSFVNLTTLPDGTVLATGGETDKSGYVDANAVKPAELWNPGTGTWTTLAAMSASRVYHSTAILLPDGRVWIGGSGGDLNVPDQLTSQIFSPPYLFKGARPSITSVSNTAQYNTALSVQTPDAASIARVSLIRTGSDTHSFDQNARTLPLTFTQTSGGISVQMPPNGNYAPPGYYMLFIVNGQGVPSVGAMINLAGTSPAPPVLSVSPTSLSFTATQGGANPAAKTANVTNTGGGTLSFTASGNQSWLGVSPTSGTAPATVTFAPNISGLAAGTYNAAVTINAGTIQGSPTQVAVTLTVNPASPIVLQAQASVHGNGSVTTSAFSTAIAGETLVAFVGGDGPWVAGGQTAAVSGAGLTWTLVKRVNESFGDSEIWTAAAPAILSGAKITATLTSPGDESLTVVALEGAKGVGAVAGGSGSTGAPSIKLTTTSATSLVFAVGNDWDQAVARGLPSGWVLLDQWLDSGSGNTFWSQYTNPPTGAAGTVLTVNDTAPTNDQWNLAAVEVVKSGG